MSTDKLNLRDHSGPSGRILIPILGAKFNLGDGSDQIEKLDDTEIVVANPEIRSSFGPITGVPDRDLQTIGNTQSAFLLHNCSFGIGDDEAGLFPSEAASARIAALFGALALECPGPATYVEMYFDADSSVKIQGTRYSSYSVLLRDYTTRIDSVSRGDPHFAPYELSYRQGSSVLTYASRLLKAQSSVKVAAERILLASQRSSAEDMIVDLCIGIEALLGAGREEIVHRLSLRAAAMLSAAGWGSSRELYTTVRDIYSYRSQVVHGNAGPYKKHLLQVGGKPIHASRFAMAALHELMRIFLTDERITSETIDDLFIFGAFDQVARRSSSAASSESES